jgi:hypothetical protein
MGSIAQGSRRGVDGAHIALAPAVGLLLAVVIATGLRLSTDWLDRDPSLAAQYESSAAMHQVGIAAQASPGPLRLVLPALSTQGRTLSASVSNSSIFQGGAASVTVPGAVSGAVTVFGTTYQLNQRADGTGVHGYFGIGVLHPAGPTSLTVQSTDIQGATTTMTIPVTILATEWTVDYIVLPPGVGSGLTPEVIQAEENLLAETYARVTPPQFGDEWHAPLDEMRITGYFGEQRSFNGGPPSGHHGGTDFGAIEGTPVYTTNAGTVVIARELAVRGNMVIVDHGGGVLSGYAHLSSMAVTEGEQVEAGQVIGGVGTTGLSTGNHLHWEMAVFGILVDGLRWLDGSQGF